MHLEPIMPYLVGAILAVLVLGLLLRSIRQPYVIGYLIAGVILGPHGVGMVEDETLLSRLGAIGVEVSPKKLIDNWQACLQYSLKSWSVHGPTLLRSSTTILGLGRPHHLRFRCKRPNA